MICRVCLKECESPLSIYGENSSEIATALQKHLSGLIDFQASQASSISTVICRNCWHQLNAFHQFYSVVEVAQTQLQIELAARRKSRTRATATENLDQDGLLEVEIEIKEEFVDNVWEEDPTVLPGERQMQENPLYEPDQVEENTNGECPEVVDMELAHEAPKDCMQVSELAEHQEIATTTDHSKTVGRVTRSRNMGCVRAKRQTPESRKAERIVPVAKAKRKPVETERKARTPRVKSISPNDDEIIKKHIAMNCELCAVSTEDFADMRNHFRAFHGDMQPYVLCCGRKLNKRFLLVQHAYKHEDPEFFKCRECQKVFSDNYVLRSHMLANHAPEEELNYKCEQCDKRFSRRYLLQLHMPSHIPVSERKFACDKCPDSKLFASEHLLSIHMNMRHKKATNVCHVCAKEIRDNQAFEKHVRLHFEDSGPRVKCPRPNCDRWLKDDDNLKQHLRRHNDEGKVFTCNECGKICKNRRALHSHLKYAHSNEVFSCEDCNKTFKKAITLKEHMAQHTGESLYKCPFCPRTFNSNANMHSHKKKMHPIEWDIWRKTKRGSSQKLISEQTKKDNYTIDLLQYDASRLTQSNPHQ